MGAANVELANALIVRAGLRIENSSLVRAWIESESAGDPVQVGLLVNNTVHWSGLADRLEHAGFDSNVPRTPCGICVDLPPAKTSPEIVEVELVTGNTVLAQATVDLSRRYIGFLDRIDLGPDGILVEGWAHDLNRPFDVVKVDLRVGKRMICSIAADRVREDLRAQKIGLGKHAFSERVKRPIRGLDAESIKIFVAGTEISLPASSALMNSGSPRTAPSDSPSISLSARSVERIFLNTVSIQPPESRVAGVCDKITEDEVFGWALDLEDKERPVVLDLLINNFVVATTETDRFRSDIAAKHQCGGFVGFHFEIIPAMKLGTVVNVTVMVRKTGHIIPHGQKTLTPCFSKSLVTSTKNGFVPSDPFQLPNGEKNRNVSGSVALIVVNRNGAELLDRHFQTFSQYNTYVDVEHVVVDHGSSDDSKKVIEKWKAAGRAITFLERGDNYSFSSSNNYAAEHTKAEYLVFCNNDIFFTKDVLHAFIDVLSRQNVGIAGIKLLDPRKTEEEFAPPIIQHLGVVYNAAKSDRVVHPVEARCLPILRSHLDDNFQAPAVTGAFLGIKRDDFVKASGFYEGYFYGYEDIDLCLQAKLILKKQIAVVASTDAVHYRGHSRKKSGLWGGPAMLRNSQLLSGRFGLAIRKILRSSVLTEHQYWTATKPVIAFAVSEAGDGTMAGDFFTAYELARELSTLVDATFVFLEENKDWYSVRDVDVLVVMTHNYDLAAMERPKQSLVTVGWARNWFSDWAKPHHEEFDIVLSSSLKGATTIRKSLGHPEEVVRIATNQRRFSADSSLEKTVDYIFTGNFWGHGRDLIYLLEPRALPYTCEIYGLGWDRVESLAPYAKGFVKYDDLADLYRRTRVVIDDANSVTKEWGSVNSRVFDAISAGALVITNSAEASEDVFGGKLPTFRDREELEALLRRFCGNEDQRLAAVRDLKAIVHEHHTYSTRAPQFLATLTNNLSGMFRIAIKVPCPSREEAHLWGDYHFALSLAKELRVLGHSVRIDLLDRWNHANRMRDDVVICLRGLSQYTPTPDQINICWLISHPTTASVSELLSYDRVYVASNKYCQSLKTQGLKNVEVLLQCVDTDLFHQGSGHREKEFGVLFVGNSRNVFRPIVRDAIAAGIPLTVIGSGWDAFLPKRMILQQNVPHRHLPEMYASARVVLNDHWDTMAEHGFISNRLFDCVAQGAYVVSDCVDGVSDLFGSLVKQYKSTDELAALVAAGLQGTPAADDAAALTISKANSFKARAKAISDFIVTSFDEICCERSRRSARFVWTEGA